MSILTVARKVIPLKIRRPLKRLLYAFTPPDRQMSSSYWQLRSFLDEAQWWDQERIRAWQLDQLVSIVTHAYNNVPGYHDLYRDAGVTPDDITTLGDIRLLPFVTKELLRDNMQEFCARNIPPWKRAQVQTGGSTGVPLRFYHADSSDWIEDAFIHASWERGGWCLGDRMLLLSSQFLGAESRYWDYDRPKRMLSLSIYHLTPDNIKDYVRRINDYQVKHLYSGPSSALVLANGLIEAGLAGTVHLESIMLGSERIEPWHLARLGQAFPGARFLCWYGHSERAILASWCKASQSYHDWPFYGFTELLDQYGHDVNPGMSGELVGTSFWSYATPFIRYRTMDSATRGGYVCPACGRVGLQLDSIDGRVRDVLIGSDGRAKVLPPNIHDDVLRNVKQLQYYQDTPGQMVMRLMVRKSFSADDAARIYHTVREFLAKEIVLKLQVVDRIPPTPAGKHRILDQRLDVSACIGKRVKSRS